MTKLLSALYAWLNTMRKVRALLAAQQKQIDLLKQKVDRMEKRK